MDLNNLVAINEKQPNGLETNKKPKKWLYVTLAIYAAIVLGALFCVAAGYAWYQG